MPFQPQCTHAQGLHTVAYGFLTRGTFPLWPLWEKYFQSCSTGAWGVASSHVDAGSAVPIFHSQEAAAHETLRQQSAAFNGYVIPIEETIQGQPRFSWKMVAMMLAVYRAVDRITAPNGCPPQWIHMASERDAPVVACPVVHRELAMHPGASRIDYNDKMEHSQWVTLWAADAMNIAGTPAHEALVKNYWEPRFEEGSPGIRVDMGGYDEIFWAAPDEVIIGWELIHTEDGPQADTLAGSHLPTHTHTPLSPHATPHPTPPSPHATRKRPYPLRPHADLICVCQYM